MKISFFSAFLVFFSVFLMFFNAFKAFSNGFQGLSPQIFPQSPPKTFKMYQKILLL